MRVPIGRGLWLRLGRHPELEERAAALEPWSVAVSGALREDRRPGTRLIASVEDRRSSLLGALVLERVAANRWHALPLILDDRAVAPLAAIVQRSMARRVYGMPAHVMPLVPLMGRSAGVERWPFYLVRREDAVRPEVDGRTRVAGVEDVPAIEEAFVGYPYFGLPGRRAIRHHLEVAVTTRLVVVVEVDGRVAGAAIADPLGDHTIQVVDLAVHPDFRGRGLAWPAMFRFALIAAEYDCAYCAGKQDQVNPMNATDQIVAHEAGDGAPVDEWIAVRLAPRPWLGSLRWRDRQVRRVHRRLGRFEQWRNGRPPPRRR